jgi:integrase/recombinase XerD
MRIKEIIPIYLKYLKTIGLSYHTVRNTKYGLRDFMRFMDEEGIYHLEDLCVDLLEEYREDLAFRFTSKGSMLSLRSQAQLLGVVKGFTGFLKQRDYLLHDPGENIRLPKKPKKLPKVILSMKDIEKLMDAPDTRTNRGYRNRIILEILYDTGIRRSEINNIKLSDIDLTAGYILIHGKGNKERVVPLSVRVCELVRNYILAVRSSFINGDDPEYLILNRWGEKMDANGVWAVVKRCVRLANLKKNITTHTLRHTCATHMLRNGAPVRHIQEMLGHESLESTQIYTHVTINDLKEIHAKYHPGENMDDKPER